VQSADDQYVFGLDEAATETEAPASAAALVLVPRNKKPKPDFRSPTSSAPLDASAAAAAAELEAKASCLHLQERVAVLEALVEKLQATNRQLMLEAEAQAREAEARVAEQAASALMQHQRVAALEAETVAATLAQAEALQLPPPPSCATGTSLGVASDSAGSSSAGGRPELDLFESNSGPGDLDNHYGTHMFSNMEGLPRPVLSEPDFLCEWAASINCELIELYNGGSTAISEAIVLGWQLQSESKHGPTIVGLTHYGGGTKGTG
jgi:hypothetical protein